MPARLGDEGDEDDEGQTAKAPQAWPAKDEQEDSKGWAVWAGRGDWRRRVTNHKDRLEGP